MQIPLNLIAVRLFAGTYCWWHYYWASVRVVGRAIACDCLLACYHWRLCFSASYLLFRGYQIRTHSNTFRSVRVQSKILLMLCFINEITNVNRFIHRYSAVANEYKLSATALCVFICSEFNNKIFHAFGRQRQRDQRWWRRYQRRCRRRCLHSIFHVQCMAIGKCSVSSANPINVHIIKLFHSLTLMQPQLLLDACIRCCFDTTQKYTHSHSCSHHSHYSMQHQQKTRIHN